MSKHFDNIIQSIIKEFNTAWNTWDISKMMNFIHPNVRIYSPMIQKVYPENASSSLIGKENLRMYWEKLMSMNGKFEVETISVEKEDRTITTLNKVKNVDMFIREEIMLDEYAKIIELKYFYSYDISLLSNRVERT